MVESINLSIDYVPVKKYDDMKKLCTKRYEQIKELEVEAKAGKELWVRAQKACKKHAIRGDELEAQINAYKNCSKDHKEKCPDVKCWVQILRDKQMDEIEQLQDENKGLKDKLKDWENSAQFVLGDDCPTDEVHCGCVVILKKRIKELEGNIVLLKKDLIKYGAHKYCPGEKCVCGFDEVKEQALKGK